MLHRFKGYTQDLDVVEGTYQLYKIDNRKLLAPLKIYIQYTERASYRDQKQKNNKKPDLKIYYSSTIAKPDENNCEGMYTNSTTCMTYGTSEDRYFSKDMLYIKFESTEGYTANLKLIYPK